MSELSSSERDALGLGDFAFPRERKLPIHDAEHVRNALARFDQVEGVTDAERDAAWTRLQAAAKRHGVELHEQSWRHLGRDGETQ